MAKKLIVLVAAVTVAVASQLGGAVSVPKDVFKITRVVKAGAGEPSIASSKDGKLYVSAIGGGLGMGFFRSETGGLSWIKGATADPSSGDTTVNIDSSGAVYQSNLVNDTSNPNLLQVDVYKSFDGGRKWAQKGATGTAENPSSENSSNSTFLVDRQWVDVYIPPGKTTDEARVYITYHTFVDGLMWVNVSKDGGKTFSEQNTIMSSPTALANGLCNVIPGGTRVVQSGPRAGRVYAVWLSGNVATNAATGCNYTQMDTFTQVWSAYSDDEGATWTNQLIYETGIFGHDASYLFADLTLDNAGNPYVAFALNDGPFPHTGGEGDQWNIFASASFDGGKTWNGKGDGTGVPYKVTTTTGTHVFPAITAGDPGRVAVAYLATDVITPQLPYGKAFPGGDPTAKWNLFLARSLDLRSAKPTWTTLQLTSKPMHTGDICNLGIFCIPEISDRSLLDFIDVVGDPDGMLHVAYTDTENGGEIMTANQLQGTPITTSPLAQPRPRVIPKLPKPKTKVLGGQLAGTGVSDGWFVGGLLVLGAAVILRRLRRA